MQNIIATVLHPRLSWETIHHKREELIQSRWPLHERITCGTPYNLFLCFFAFTDAGFRFSCVQTSVQPSYSAKLGCVHHVGVIFAMHAVWIFPRSVYYPDCVSKYSRLEMKCPPVEKRMFRARWFWQLPSPQSRPAARIPLYRRGTTRVP